MHLPESMSQSLKLVAGMSLPLGLLCVGAALQFNALKYAGRALILNTFGRLIFVPILAYVGCLLFGLATFETMIVVVFFSLPTASAAYVLTKYFQGDSQLMAAIISLQTLCFGLTFPLWMWFLQS
ncbi:AEC family transporter [Acinetobacter johnsonii]|nr:AEC family transporter [Acinetobacter johnsonii]